jgi:hypothetical protein
VAKEVSVRPHEMSILTEARDPGKAVGSVGSNRGPATAAIGVIRCRSGSQRSYAARFAARDVKAPLDKTPLQPRRPSSRSPNSSLYPLKKQEL